jgi:SAM-dependent methyltransferase
MTVTPDGCSVELYAQLPSLGEGQLLHGRLPRGAAVLDLGCGTGRIARQLAELGHSVVAVDESAEMLARVPLVPTIRTVLARIQELRLEKRFDAVLLASNLINTEDAQLRQAMLATCRHHLGPGGHVFAQWRPPNWFRSAPRNVTLGAIAVSQQLRDLDGVRFAVTAAYRLDERSWHHDYVAIRLTDEELVAALEAADLQLIDWLIDDRTWFAVGAR